MPGIAGVIFPDVFQEDNSLGHIMDCLKHRGDKYKVQVFKNFHLAHSCGNINRYKNIVIGLDGILYNKKKLIGALEEHFYISPHASDEELIAKAYLYWGNECLKKLEGDFAFFLLDEKKEKLLLARDCMGKKPLYWYANPRYFIFASELKGLLGSRIIPQTADLDAFASYLYFGFIPQDLSPIQGVSKLLPGYFLQLNANRNFSIQPYWSYAIQYQNPLIENPSLLTHTIDSILKKSVAERASGIDSVGCAISGELGSASVAYYLNSLNPSTKLHAFTVGFQHDSYQNLQAAHEVVKALNLPYTKEVITPRTFFDDFIKMIWYLDEPLADLNIISTWKLAALAQSKKVLFSGMGCDEILAGHGQYRDAEKKSPFSFNEVVKNVLPFLKSHIVPLIYRLSKGHAYGLLKHSQGGIELSHYLNQNALFPENIFTKAAPGPAKFFDPCSFLHRFSNAPWVQSQSSSFRYFDLRMRLADSYIMQYERLTAAHGLDWRTPYLSMDLIQYLAEVVESNQLASPEPFFILKNILQDAFPPSIIQTLIQTTMQRPKVMRRDFLKSWIESTGLLKIFQKLPKGILVEQRFISESWLRKQVSSADQCKASFPYLWGILILEIWCRLYINKPIRENPPEIGLLDFLEES